MPDEAQSPEWTVMTANVGAGLAPDEAIVAAVRAEAPDIVAFQELPQAQARRLRETLGDLYGHAVFYGDGNEGRGILSRFPIRSSSVVEIAAGRPDCVAIVDIGGVGLTVVVAHPRPQRITRSGLLFTFSSLRQVLRLARLTVDAAPAVLLGDLNMTPRHPGYRRLIRLGLRDAWDERRSARGLTFPTRIGYTRWSNERMARQRVMPMVRFDYIWCTTQITVLAAWVGPDTGSDHAPVLARLCLPGTSPPPPPAP